MPSTSALSQARERLREEPLKLLFERVAVPLAELGTTGAWLRSWRLLAIGGVNIDVPDTAENLTMLVTADRGFLSFELWAEFMATGADLIPTVERPIVLRVRHR